jgi:hypothetical protein
MKIIKTQSKTIAEMNTENSRQKRNIAVECLEFLIHIWEVWDSILASRARYPSFRDIPQALQ